jgi:hypothetical protein
LSPIGIVGFGALGILVVCWLVISFTEPSPRRAVLEWLAAASLYTALLMLFVNLLLRSLERDSTLGLVAFGFLAALFAAGLVMTLYTTLRSLRGPGKQQSSATN